MQTDESSVCWCVAGTTAILARCYPSRPQAGIHWVLPDGGCWHRGRQQLPGGEPVRPPKRRVRRSSHTAVPSAACYCMLCCLPEIGKAFVSHYYSTFPVATRANLQTLFNDQSLLTWEGNPSQQFMGMTNIMTHLVVRDRATDHPRRPPTTTVACICWANCVLSLPSPTPSAPSPTPSLGRSSLRNRVMPRLFCRTAREWPRSSSLPRRQLVTASRW